MATEKDLLIKKAHRYAGRNINFSQSVTAMSAMLGLASHMDPENEYLAIAAPAVFALSIGADVLTALDSMTKLDWHRRRFKGTEQYSSCSTIKTMSVETFGIVLGTAIGTSGYLLHGIKPVTKVMLSMVGPLFSHLWVGLGANTKDTEINLLTSMADDPNKLKRVIPPTWDRLKVTCCCCNGSYDLMVDEELGDVLEFMSSYEDSL